MATHSSILAWKIPWTEEPGGLQSMGLQRVRHNRATEHSHIHVVPPSWPAVRGLRLNSQTGRDIWFRLAETSVFFQLMRESGGYCLACCRQKAYWCQLPGRGSFPGSSGRWTWPWWASNSVSVALPAPWRPPGTLSKAAPSSPPLYTLRFPWPWKIYMFIDCHAETFFCHACTTLWTAFLGISFLFFWGFMSPCRWHLSRGCLGCDDISQGRMEHKHHCHMWTDCLGSSRQPQPVVYKQQKCFFQAHRHIWWLLPLLPSFSSLFLSLSSFLPSLLPPFPSFPSFFPPLPLLQRNHIEIGKNDANELTCKTDSQIEGTDLWLPNERGVGEGWVGDWN